MKRGEAVELPDEDLLRLALSQPQDAQAREAASQLLGRHQQKVYVWCFRYVRDHDRALDLSQDVLLKAYRSLGSFGGRSRFTSWLFAITRNQCLSSLRAPKLLSEGDEEIAEFPDSALAADVTLEHVEEEEAFQQLLAETLEPYEADALWMRCIEKMPVEEITRVLEIQSSSGARGVLQTARRKLRAALARRQEGGRSS